MHSSSWPVAPAVAAEHFRVTRGYLEQEDDLPPYVINWRSH